MKTALVTGSTSGIGLGVARALAAAGYSVAIHGIEEEAGKKLAQELAQEFGVKTLFSNADLRNPDASVQMIRDTEKEWGSLDVLVNNAGIQYVAPIDEFPAAKWNDIMAINLSSVFHLSQAVWPGMKKRGFGRIINIASVHGIRASEFKSAYVSAKHGVIGLTKVLGLEGAPFGISCNAICPGYVKTPLVEKQIADQAKANKVSPEEVVTKVLLKKQAVKDFVPIEAISDMVLYLASKNAQTVTGTSFVLDGGWSAQ